MSETIELMGLKTKLGLDVFKHDKEPHIKIKTGMEKDPRLLRAVKVCPAGLYSVNAESAVELSIDGCLECGTCRIACGIEILEWNYPNAACGVQFRFG